MITALSAGPCSLCRYLKDLSKLILDLLLDPTILAHLPHCTNDLALSLVIQPVTLLTLSTAVHCSG